MPDMIGWFARLTVALLLSGFGATATYLALFNPAEFVLFTMGLVWPVVLFVSLPLGWGCYALLRRLNVPLTLPVCLATGALLGAVSGVFLITALNLLPYRGVDRHAENPDALRLHRDMTLPLVLAGIGAAGGLIFAASGRVLRIR